ncbi:hypothetical protein JRO89_XS08G0036200 [Xanthoceras sorbifolium]|uniref:DUF7865 domain-containing protein n=1 Tax=Xanthoceras sorbifolium TaxID=99658 RepID=A0ABQ8HNJ8_9ROSI|nr:hypothetical protein JRO89_XS08G0036200 [Xanthoceras sorbifolium]
MASNESKKGIGGGGGFFASVISGLSNFDSAMTKLVNGLLGYEGLEVINPEGSTKDSEEEAKRGRWKQEVSSFVNSLCMIVSPCDSLYGKEQSVNVVVRKGDIDQFKCYDASNASVGTSVTNSNCWEREGYWKMMQKYIGSDIQSMVILPVLIFEPMTMLIQTSDSFFGLLLFAVGFLLFMVAFVKDREFQSFFAKGCVLLHVSMAVWRVGFERKLDDLAHDWPKHVVGDFALAPSWVFFLVYSWREKYD